VLGINPRKHISLTEIIDTVIDKNVIFIGRAYQLRGPQGSVRSNYGTPAKGEKVVIGMRDVPATFPEGP
jgi:hypothetical protein